MDEAESEHLDALVRRVDPDRWLSSRFVGDAGRRDDVVAVYAFDHELARAPRVASNPLLGEIRLTWWREALDEIFEDRAVRRHPTALALARAVRRRGLPRDLLEAMIDARYRELDRAPMTEAEALEWARGTGGRAAQVASLILDPDSRPDLAVYAGTLWAMGKRFGEEPTLRLAIGELMTHASIDARFMSAQALPAAAHAALTIHRPVTDLGKRLRLVWTMARGRL